MSLPPKLAAPVVLVHGLSGFDRMLAARPAGREYFRGVRDYLEAGGNTVFAPRVSPTAAVATRAAELKQFLDRTTGRQPVHLVGHSLGGLDARYLVSRLGMADRVLSVTTVGTPHRGTAFADWGVRRFVRLLAPLLRTVGLSHEAFLDLTTDSCRRFNDRVPDAPGVRYFSVAGVCDATWLVPEWWLPYSIVGRAEGPNDGVVSVASARWGERTEVWRGDHLNLINWPNRKAFHRGEWTDRAADYGRIVGHLAAVGF